MSNLNDAIQFINDGNKTKGRAILNKLVQEQPENETVWLWLAAAEDTEEAKRRCLKRALALNPDNDTARQALTRLGEGGLPLPQLADIVPPVEATAAQRYIPRRNQGGRNIRIILGLLPLIIPAYPYLFLTLTNSRYIGKMWLSCSAQGVGAEKCTQPVGWIMTAICILFLLSYLLILLGIEFSVPSERIGVRVATLLVCILVFVIPVTIIIWMGPAILIVMESSFR